MKRRSFLTATGVGALAGLSGCTGGPGGDSGGDSGPSTSDPTTDSPQSEGAPFEHAGTIDQTLATNGDFPDDGDPSDGYGPEFPDPPEAPGADPSSFETLRVNDESVRLAPIDVVEAWYRRGDARIVDARGLGQYTNAHVFGAVLSPAQGDTDGGPIPDWPTEDRVVTYCACPHHLSSLRAAGLQKAGFTDVFALNEGFAGQDTAWFESGYPMAGTSFESGTQASVSEWTVSGTVDSRYAGEYVHAAADRQYEAGPVASDGSYELTLRFWNASDETSVTLETPAYTVTRPVGELAAGPIDGPG